MTPDQEPAAPDPPLHRRVTNVVVSIVVLAPVTVVLGYGGWTVLSLTARLAGYDPEASAGDRLRDRLLAWPDRNRDVMRTNGGAPLPLKP